MCVQKSLVFDFPAQPDEKSKRKHRLFLFSADLLHEGEDRLWTALPEWKVAVHDIAMQFVKAQQGDNDVLVFCDGRSRSCRMALEQGTKGLRHMTGRLQTVWEVGKDGLLVERQRHSVDFAAPESSDAGQASASPRGPICLGWE